MASRYHLMILIAFFWFFVGSFGLPKTCQECVKTKGAVWEVDYTPKALSVHCVEASECENTFDKSHTKVCETDCDHLPRDPNTDWTVENDHIEHLWCPMNSTVLECATVGLCVFADANGQGRCDYEDLAQTLAAKVLCPREAGSPCQACIANGKIWKVHLDNGTYDLECVDECTEKASKLEQVLCIKDDCSRLHSTKEIRDWTVYATKEKYTQCSINLLTTHECVKDPECALVHDSSEGYYCTFKQIAQYFDKTDLCPGTMPSSIDGIPLSMKSLSPKNDGPLPVEIPTLQGEDPLYPTCQLCSEAQGRAWQILIVANKVIVKCQTVDLCKIKIGDDYINFCVDDCDSLPEPSTVKWTERGEYIDSICPQNSTLEQCLTQSPVVDKNMCSWVDLGTTGVCSYTTIFNDLNARTICPYKYNTDCQQCTQKGKVWQISLTNDKTPTYEAKCVEDCTQTVSPLQQVMCIKESQCNYLKPTKEIKSWVDETKVPLKQCSSGLDFGQCVADADCTIAENSSKFFCTFKQISDYFHSADLCSPRK